MHVDGAGGQTPCGRPHRKLKLESTDVLPSFHAKKSASLLPELRLWMEQKVENFRQYYISRPNIKYSLINEGLHHIVESQL